jgi:hypothetical protein
VPNWTTRYVEQKRERERERGKEEKKEKKEREGLANSVSGRFWAVNEKTADMPK